MKLVTIIFLFLWALCWALTSLAAPTKQPPVYYWPSSPRQVSKATQQWVKFDTAVIRMTYVTVMGTTLDIPYISSFAFERTDTQRWNATFISSAQPVIRWGITSFRKGDVLPDLSTESLRGYIRGLHRTPNTTEILSSVDDQIDVRLSILGQHPEAISYIIKERAKRIEYFFELNGKIWIFAYEAPVELFEANLEEIHVIWSRMALNKQRR